MVDTVGGAEKSVEDTPEFYVPAQGLDLQPYLRDGDIAGIHHLGRYYWACQVLAHLRPATVLDVACGAGYGTHMLAEALPASAVTGCDYDPRSKVHADAHYRRDNLRYVAGNMVTWQYRETGEPMGRYDGIVSFDTIEHLLHREVAILSIVRNLADDGVFLFSTPCAHEADVLNPGWEHHKIEYSYRTLVPLLKYFFRSVAMAGDPDFIAGAFWTGVINRDVLRYPTIGNPLICRGPIRHG